MGKLTKKQIEISLRTLKDKGYVKIGVEYVDEDMIDVLLIHKDQKEFDLFGQVKQALDDLPKDIKEEFLVRFEVPTLYMYENERVRGPNHKILEG